MELGGYCGLFAPFASHCAHKPRFQMEDRNGPV